MSQLCIEALAVCANVTLREYSGGAGGDTLGAALPGAIAAGCGVLLALLKFRPLRRLLGLDNEKIALQQGVRVLAAARPPAVAVPAARTEEEKKPEPKQD